jgi:hypothetical protein
MRVTYNVKDISDFISYLWFKSRDVKMGKCFLVKFFFQKIP